MIVTVTVASGAVTTTVEVVLTVAVVTGTTVCVVAKVVIEMYAIGVDVWVAVENLTTVVFGTTVMVAIMLGTRQAQMDERAALPLFRRH